MRRWRWRPIRKVNLTVNGLFVGNANPAMGDPRRCTYGPDDRQRIEMSLDQAREHKLDKMSHLIAGGGSLAAHVHASGTNDAEEDRRMYNVQIHEIRETCLIPTRESITVFSFNCTCTPSPGRMPYALNTATRDRTKRLNPPA
ncbi:hypothetical protein IFM61392_09385 [Aspergillus lentulus]|nr:hypothetical protein IFM61392_09385 [Aspergillus lentulus]